MFSYQAAADLLANRVILVTGAGDGIGRAAAHAFASHGATVILLGKTVPKLEETYDQLTKAGSSTPAIIPLDLQGASEEHYRDLAATIEAEFGRLDGILHNAGLLGTLSPFEFIDSNEWEKLLKVNVTAPMLLTKALLPLLRRSADAAVVFTSSGVGRKGRAFWNGYAVSKFAVEGLMQVLADELEDSPVRVAAINPGATRTSMRAAAYPAEDSSTLPTPDALMPAYLFVMGPDGRAAHGQSIDAQG